MSRTEVIEAVDSLSREDREYVEAYLRARNLSEDEQFQLENGKRLQEMKAGRGFKSEETRQLHQTLKDKGL
ncbi:MAG: hypothetical protein AAGJ81_16050 [Verrucomicrobiota bacterium]